MKESSLDYSRTIYCTAQDSCAGKQNQKNSRSVTIGQVMIDDEHVSDELLMSLNLQSKKVDLQKAFEIIVSENAGHLEAYDSIN